VPDQRSFKRTFKPGDSRLADWVAQNERECEFPYPRFDHYLKSRGLDHLVPIAAWCTTGKRTKNFINLLKIRLDFWHPAKCASVARNEAHVRLMASMWFMSRALQFVALGGCVVSSITYFAAVTMHLTHPVLVLVPTAPALLILAIATLTRFIIEHFLHYQRVREVFWVLETSYTAFCFAPAHIQDICPDFHEPDFER
jgi:hypothetical protein